MSPNVIAWAGHHKLLLACVIAFCLVVSSVALVRHVHKHSTGTTLGFLRSIVNLTEHDKATGYFRLPRYVVPERYHLQLWPDMDTKRFRGSVKIQLQVLEPTHIIQLHSNKLDIDTVFFRSNGHDIPILSINATNDKRELLMVELLRQIPKGPYEIFLSFGGKLDGIVGFYASHLKDGKKMVASKFQPTYARQAFPCFDEPDFKATFDITLIKPESYIALSNMNEKSKTIDNTTKLETVNFATSVPMSTYLACFVICDFDHKEVEINANGIGKNFTLRSFAQKYETHKIDFAQDIGKRATEFYINYYQVPFPLPKLDMIAIPDYVSGATEHWGLITYRETQFLVDEATASASNKIGVANTIAHELAHMWFGNLVTMKWWDEVWLNEGFASYMQVKSLNAIEPSWTMLDQFLTKTLHPVLITDAKLSSHPIVQNVATPDQITAIFDTISYNKGSSILRMLEGFTGEENFRRGVSDYLKKYEFGNTITQQLLTSLEPYFKVNNPNMNLAYIMDTWTRQSGYPLLTVEPAAEDGVFTIRQTRFLLDPQASYTNDSDYNYRWFVPITYKTNKGLKEKILWFPDNTDSVQLKLETDESWLKINNNHVGYYRVNYTEAMWRDLVQLLKDQSEQLTISDRSQLINDAFSLAMAKVVPYELALELSTYLPAERDLVPWDTAGRLFAELSDRLSNSSSLNLLQNYVQNLIKPLYKQQSWENKESAVISSLLRSKVLSLALRFELPEAKSKVKELFLSWLNNYGTPTAVHIQTDLRDFVYVYGMKSASQEEWNRLWDVYVKEDDVQEKAKIRIALTAPRDTHILKKFLELAWNESNIRSQDYLSVLHYISSNPAGTSLVWDDVRGRWSEYVDRFTLNSRYLGNLVPGITSGFDTEDRLKEMEAFFAKYPEAGAGETARKRAAENVRYNIKWIKDFKCDISSWLKANNRSTEGPFKL